MSKPLQNALLLLFFLTFGQCHAQLYGKEDSLLKLYKKADANEQKNEIINHLVNVYLYSEPEKAKKYIEEGLQLSQQIRSPKCLNMFYYQKGVYFHNLYKTDSSTAAYKQALKYALELKNDKAVLRAKNGLALQELEKGNFDESIRLLKELQPLSQKMADTLTEAVLYSQLANAYKAKGYNKISLEYLQKSIKILKKLNAEMRLADAYYMLGDLEINLGNYEACLQHYEVAAEIYRRQKDYYFLTEILYSIAFMETERKNWTAAEIYADSTLKFAEEHGTTHIEGRVESIKAEVAMHRNNFGLAKRLFESSNTHSLEIEDHTTEANNHAMLGKMYNLMRQPEQAISYLDKSLAHYQENNMLGGLINSYIYRSESYKQLGNYEKALDDFEQYKTWSDSSAHIEKIKQIEELRMLFDTEQKEAKIATLGLQVEKSKLQKSLLTGGLLSAAAIMGLLYYGFRQKSKRNKAEFEKQEALITRELAFKKKELVSQTLHLVNKNSLITDLQNDLIEIRKTAKEHTKEIGKIIKDLQQENTSDANWEVFKSHFAVVHNDFDLKLRKLAPDVTDNEIRLAAFLKMKLSTKEIASMLNVQPDSITKSKYRLKKKFNLDAEADFDAFLDEV